MGKTLIKKAKVLKLEVLGAIFIIFLGSLLHFTYEWSGKFWLLGIFSAVNESPWEHLKLAVFPATLWFLLERQWLKKEKIPNFVFAKVKGIFLMPTVILVIFYSYTAILGKNYLLLDILSFVVAVFAGQLLSFWIMLWPPMKKIYQQIGVVFLVLLLLAFGIFTFWTPKIFLFRDPISGGFGLEEKKRGEVCFRNECFNVELAKTEKEHERGLMFRKILGKDEGMLFIFRDEGIYPFWMKNTFLPLDIVWIDKDFRVVYISKNTLPCEENLPCPTISPKEKAKYVLEVKGETAERIGLRVGEKVNIEI